MAKAIFGFNYATHRDADEYSGAYDNANYTVEQAGEILSDGDYEHAAERKDVYERAFANSPEDFAQTFSIIDRMEKDAAVHTGIKEDDQGNEHFVAMFRNVYGSGLDVAISEGHLILNSLQGISHEQYQSLARFCWMNSLNIQFPDNVDEHFRHEFEQASAAFEQEVRLGRGENDDAVADAVDNELNEEHLSDEQISEAASHLPEDERPDFIFEQRRQRAAEKATATGKSEKSPSEKKLDKHMQTFMKRLGKTSGETFFRSKSWVSGETVYRLYKDPSAYKKDGRPQKDGSVSNTYEIEIRFKVDKDENLSFTYGTPNNAPIDQPYADEIVGMMKAQGYTHITFEQPMLDADKAKFREACARNGVIPEGFNLNEFHAQKMITIAAGSLSKKDLLIYKERMAERLRRQLKEQNIDFNSEDNRLRDLIVSLEGEVASSPKDYRYGQFHQAYDGVKDSISDHLHHITRQVDPSSGRTDAVKIIGAANAFSEFFESYDQHCTSTVKEFLDANVLNLPEERQEFLEKTGLSPDDQTKLMDLEPKHLVTIYKCMIKEQEGKAEQIFQTQFSNPDREEKDADFVKDLVRQTTETMRDKAYTLKAKGGGDIYIESLGNPKYLGPVTPKNYNNAMRRGRGGYSR